MIDIQRLEQIAVAHKNGSKWWQDKAFFDYIEAVTPSTILELIHRVKVLERAVEMAAYQTCLEPSMWIEAAERELSEVKS